MLHQYVCNSPGDVKYGTSGKPVPGYEVRLVDEQGRDAPDGEVGEMLVKGPSAAEGYWNQREKSRATFEGGWTRSGDKYTRDAEGYYTYQGRTDDMFKVSGIWVSPFEVESALIGHAAVLEAAVVPKEDADGLLKPKAFIVLKPGKTAGNGLRRSSRSTSRRRPACGNIPRWIDVRGRPAQDGDGQDPALQAARGLRQELAGAVALAFRRWRPKPMSDPRTKASDRPPARAPPAGRAPGARCWCPPPAPRTCRTRSAATALRDRIRNRC